MLARGREDNTTEVDVNLIVSYTPAYKNTVSDPTSTIGDNSGIAVGTDDFGGLVLDSSE